MTSCGGDKSASFFLQGMGTLDIYLAKNKCIHLRYIVQERRKLTRTCFLSLRQKYSQFSLSQLPCLESYKENASTEISAGSKASSSSLMLSAATTAAVRSITVIKSHTLPLCMLAKNFAKKSQKLFSWKALKVPALLQLYHQGDTQFSGHISTMFLQVFDSNLWSIKKFCIAKVYLSRVH